MQGFIFYFRLRNKITSKHWSAWNHKQVWLLQIQYNLKPTYKILLKNILKSKSYVCIDTHTHTHWGCAWYFCSFILFSVSSPFQMMANASDLNSYQNIFFFWSYISCIVFFFLFFWKWFSVDKATREQTHKVASIEKATLN